MASGVWFFGVCVWGRRWDQALNSLKENRGPGQLLTLVGYNSVLANIAYEARSPLHVSTTTDLFLVS